MEIKNQEWEILGFLALNDVINFSQIEYLMYTCLHNSLFIHVKESEHTFINYGLIEECVNIWFLWWRLLGK